MSHFNLTGSKLAPLAQVLVQGTLVAVIEMSDKVVSVNVDGQAWRTCTPAKWDELLQNNVDEETEFDLVHACWVELI